MVVGGVAVVLHGYPRFTADLDLVVELTASNASAAIAALQALGYRPRAPVRAEDFAVEDIRASWREDKGLTVFSLWSPSYPGTEVDLFVEEPFDFGEAWSRRRMMKTASEKGWKTHEEEQRSAWLKLTPAQRLAWLEDAKRFAEAAKRARKTSAAARSGDER